MVCAFIALFSFYFLYVAKNIVFLAVISLVCVFVFIFAFLLFKKKHISLNFFATLISVCLGFIASIFSYVSFLNSNMPPITLAGEKDVKTITVCLNTDAKPVGANYYLIEGEILSAKCKNSAIYSCNGKVEILIPSSFIRQNYAGGLTSNRSAEDITLFCKGIIMEVTGCFSSNKRKEKLPYFSSTFLVDSRSPCKFLQFSSSIYAYRTNFRFFINRLLYGWGEGGNLLLALLTSNRDFIQKEEVGAFRAAGLSHVLALSGMHLAIVGSLVTFLASLFFRRKVLKLFVLLMTFLFLIFAGLSPSLLRAFLMLCIVLISREFSPQINLLGVLSVTLFVHLLLFPQDALTLSFALSYGALFGIIFFGDAVSYFLNPYIPDFLNESISASLGAIFFTSPIIALTIGEVSFIGIVSSILVSPLISLFLSFGIIAIVLSLIIPQSYEIFGIILNFFYQIIINIVYVFSKFPYFCFEENALGYFFSFLPFFIGVLIVILKRRMKLLKRIN